jgi:HAMP domain-containing protein
MSEGLRADGLISKILQQGRSLCMERIAGSDDAHREILEALRALQRGDFSVRLGFHGPGILSEIAHVVNELADLGDTVSSEVIRVSKEVGREGRLSERISVPAIRGSWAQGIEAINELIEDLGQPTAEAARIITAVAQGDLSHKMALSIDGRPLKGEFAQMGRMVNEMVEQLSLFTAEVTRVAREVGTEGKLGGQAKDKGMLGSWKDLTDSVNGLASNLTNQVRNIAKVTTAVARGDFSQKITVNAQGEILELKNTVNTMVDQLNGFAAEVTRVAYEVGTEGKLGGQAKVQGLMGTWKDLTDNVNVMAANLTKQVRSIIKVVTAVANGDLAQKY